ncbi:MAG: SDR family NAD(P)-dependent oxidoreductase [Thermomicrobiales bacterium]
MNDHYWRGRRVLVTGSEGFIGSTLVDMLVERGAHVRAFAHYKPYAAEGNLARYIDDDRVEMLAGDVRDPFLVASAVDGVDTVFHLAALIGIPYSYIAPESYVQTNVVGAHNVVAACHRYGARLIHTSTSETYGSALFVPMAETHPPQPQSPYSASKIAADAMVLSYHAAFGTPVSICRPFNTYGPRQSARAVIPAILRQLAAGATEIRLGATTTTRDFTYVTDTAAGFLAIGSTDSAIGRAVNLGTGREISVGELASLLVSLAGSEASVVTDASRHRPETSEVDRLLSDNTVARSLGWSPTVSLEDGLRMTWEWVQSSIETGATRFIV